MKAGAATFLPAALSFLLRLFGCAFYMLAFTAESMAQLVDYTEPRGIYVVKIAGTAPGETQRRTYLGVQLVSQTQLAGQVGGVSGDSFSFPGSLFSPRYIEDPVRSSYVHVMDGNGRGFVSDIVEFRENDIKCAADLAPWMSPFTSVRIRTHPNLADLFGVDNRFSLASGTSAETADNVVAWDTETQQEKVYFYHSVRQRWEEEDINADAGSASLKFPYGIYIIRRSSGNLRVSLSGEISGAPILLPVRPGVNVFSLPINLTSSLANLIPASGDFPVISGVNAAQGDLITLEEPYSGLQRGPFYLSSRPGATGWRKVGANATDETIEPLDFLCTLIIRRDGPAGYVRVEENREAGPGFPIPADPEAGETPLIGEFPIPRVFPPGLTYAVETSTDLQNWSDRVIVGQTGEIVSFVLPTGQGRAFYRLRVSFDGS